MNHIYDNISLLTTSKNTKSFPTVLEMVQEYISSHYAAILKENPHESSTLIKSYIEKYIENEHILVENLTQNELVENLYGEMTGFSFLSKYIYRDDVEEVNINRWDDVKILYADGSVVPTTEKFHSPIHALDVIRRMLSKSNMIIDNSQPIILGDLSKRIRITAIGEPIIDKGAGISASIRIINPKHLQKQDFIDYGTATKEIIEFLVYLHTHDISMCITGSTGSGKTTIMSFLLEQVPVEKRIVTIEGVREFNLVRYDDNNNVINNIIHLTTRLSDNEKQSIGQDKLVETSMTFDPDILVIAEMKGAEAVNAVNAANTGHTIITTIHANSCFDTYYRIATLYKMQHNIDDDTLMKMITASFPIVVFAKKLADNSRRIMEISECIGVKDGTPIVQTIFKHEIINVTRRDDKVQMTGRFVKVNKISDNLLNRLRGSGMSDDEEAMFSI